MASTGHYGFLEAPRFLRLRLLDFDYNYDFTTAVKASVAYAWAILSTRITMHAVCNACTGLVCPL